jgi:hypothetical protein
MCIEAKSRPLFDTVLYSQQSISDEWISREEIKLLKRMLEHIIDNNSDDCSSLQFLF